MIELPDAIRVNAWLGTESPSSPLGRNALGWQGVGESRATRALRTTRAPPAPVDVRDWRDARVGWGLVLPDNERLSPADRSRASDAPESVQSLVAARGPAPVLRHRPDHADGFLRRYYADGSSQDLDLALSAPGIGNGQIPRYLLIYASPTIVSWQFQYAANLRHFVGRLDLTDRELENYVTALLHDWKDAPCNPRTPLIWSVSHGEPDISWLMDGVISQKLARTFAADQDLRGHAVRAGAKATAAELTQALAAMQPALIVTTSHGMTGPLDDAPSMQRNLGFLVDVDHQLVTPDALLAQWAPGGAIWYSHACCSAGSDGPSRYAGLFDPGSSLERTLSGIAAGCGARVAPLPSRLLGAPRPLRAFVGHVEPTFDWTLRHPETRQPLTYALQEALYTQLYRTDGPRTPIGCAVQDVYDEAGGMLALYLNALSAVQRNKPQARERALYRQLVAMDRQQMVILGDPTVALPPLP